MPPNEVLVRFRGVTKDYRGLRPLRIAELDLHAGRSLALIGFDQVMAEVLVELMTGAALPDSGEVAVFGEPTSAIAGPDQWLQTLDKFGILTDRAVLVEQFTVEQNLAIPLSLAVDNMPAELRAQVARLAAEVGLGNTDLSRQAGALSAVERARIRLGRALALRPRVLVAEHPNATLTGEDAAHFASDIARIVEARGLASVVLTADHVFAKGAAKEVLVLESSTGALRQTSAWRRLFS